MSTKKKSTIIWLVFAIVFLATATASTIVVISGIKEPNDKGNPYVGISMFAVLVAMPALLSEIVLFCGLRRALRYGNKTEIPGFLRASIVVMAVNLALLLISCTGFFIFFLFGFHWVMLFVGLILLMASSFSEIFGKTNAAENSDMRKKYKIMRIAFMALNVILLATVAVLAFRGFYNRRLNSGIFCEPIPEFIINLFIPLAMSELIMICGLRFALTNHEKHEKYALAIVSCVISAMGFVFFPLHHFFFTDMIKFGSAAYAYWLIALLGYVFLLAGTREKAVSEE